METMRNEEQLMTMNGSLKNQVKEQENTINNDLQLAKEKSLTKKVNSLL